MSIRYSNQQIARYALCSDLIRSDYLHDFVVSKIILFSMMTHNYVRKRVKKRPFYFIVFPVEKKTIPVRLLAISITFVLFLHFFFRRGYRFGKTSEGIYYCYSLVITCWQK